RTNRDFQRIGLCNISWMRSIFSCWGIAEHAASSNDHSLSSVALIPGMTRFGAVDATAVHAVAPAIVDAGVVAGSARICTRFAAVRFLAIMLAEGTPVFTNDFSQSCDEGPRMFPSMYARPGHREQFETCEHDVQVV